MAPSLHPRVDSVPDSGHGISTSIIIGIAVIAAAVVALAVVLAVVYFRRKNRQVPSEENSSIEKEPPPADLQALRPPASLVRSVSRRNLTPSIILPGPVPPIPAARPRPPRNTPPAGRPLSSAEVLAHHEATGTTPRAFGPMPASAFSPGIPPKSPSSAGPFSFALNAPTARSSPDLTTSPGVASFHTAPSRPGSVVSFSRQSILSTSHPGSSLRASLSSLSSTGTAGGDPLKVHHVFTPLLPDELVLRRGERVALVQSYDDGWYVVGRRAPWAAKSPRTPGTPTQYAFGHPSAHNAPDEVELGAVPAWVFQRASGLQERPMRSASLGVTLVLAENERREDIISWSNF